MTTTTHGPLQALETLVGTWTISGPESGGQVRYEWSEDGSTLIQHVDLVNGDEHTTGVETIRYDEEGGAFRSRYVGGSGEVLDYVYELTGDTLTIWFGEVGSPAKFSGKFSPDGRTNVGEWSWPGGGYSSTMTRVG